jgi:hypothetical protein
MGAKLHRIGIAVGVKIPLILVAKRRHINLMTIDFYGPVNFWKERYPDLLRLLLMVILGNCCLIVLVSSLQALKATKYLEVSHQYKISCKLHLVCYGSHTASMF